MTSQSALIRDQGERGPFIKGMSLKRGLVILGLILIGLLSWGLFWDNTDWLSSPSDTWEALIEILQTPSTYSNIADTARRLVIGLSLGYTVGVAIAFIAHQSQWWAKFTRPYVFVALSTPGLAFSLISLMVFGLSDTGVYCAVAGVIFPFVANSLTAGLNSIDTRLTEMSSVYRFSWFDRIWHQALPEIAPHLFAAFRNVHALAWKIVVLSELFSTQSGIGFQYKRAFAFFSTTRLVVWAFFFVMMVMTVEYGVLRPLERNVFKWRS
jgi:NitT/TauT family transport system permease protein